MKLKKITKSDIKSYYIPFILLFVLALLMNSKAHIQVGDDTVFINSFKDNGGIMGWLKSYTAIWSGRIVPHFILISLLNCNIIIWKIINSAIITLLGLGIFKFTINTNNKLTDDDKTKLSLFICSILFFIPTSVVSSGILWITGSFTYLWPTMFAIFVLIPFKRLITGEKQSKPLTIAAFISVFYASYVEQSAAIIIAFPIVAILAYIISNYIDKKKLSSTISSSWHYYLMIILIGINSYISLSAVGNSVRNQAETIKWYPDFDMLSFIDKIFLGATVTYDHLFNNAYYLMVILSLLIAILIFKKKTDIVTRILPIIPITYSSARILSVDILFDFKNTDKAFVSTHLSQYIPFVCATFVCLITMYLIFIIYDNYKEGLVTLLLFGGALSETLIMGISPTVYASGSRIFFVTDVLIIMCIIRFFYHLYITYYEEIKKKSLLIIIPCAIAIILWLNFSLVIATKAYF